MYWACILCCGTAMASRAALSCQSAGTHRPMIYASSFAAHCVCLSPVPLAQSLCTVQFSISICLMCYVPLPVCVSFVFIAQSEFQFVGPLALPYWTIWQRPIYICMLAGPSGGCTRSSIPSLPVLNHSADQSARCWPRFEPRSPLVVIHYNSNCCLCNTSQRLTLTFMACLYLSFACFLLTVSHALVSATAALAAAVAILVRLI